MKVSIFASIICLFSITVLAAPPPPPPPPKKMCKTYFTTPDKPIVIDSVSGQCYNLQVPAYPHYIQVMGSNSNLIAAFKTRDCNTMPIFNQQSPVQLKGPTYIASFKTHC